MWLFLKKIKPGNKPNSLKKRLVTYLKESLFILWEDSQQDDLEYRTYLVPTHMERLNTHELGILHHII